MLLSFYLKVVFPLKHKFLSSKHVDFFFKNIRVQLSRSMFDGTKGILHPLPTLQNNELESGCKPVLFTLVQVRYQKQTSETCLEINCCILYLKKTWDQSYQTFLA